MPPELVTPNVPIEPGAPFTQATPVVAAAFEAMVAAALQEGYELQLTSGYRSFEDQQATYERFVRDYGTQVAAERVALPGTSEHQTGLTVDVGEVDLPNDEEFGDTASSDWVRGNAHRFGFIVRYPPDKARHHRLRRRTVAPAVRGCRSRDRTARQWPDDGRTLGLVPAAT